ncbi:hypothetical protein [Saccharothrix australiensis]|uniref:Uncharacterized protein n=1 Tax=Saccharothrix australiensis TaxID=2072 RepID=A0A495VJD1_9PSEU|nr:hypothetical protein [Saccharothrix australiensis]RKT49362.1 hypothetical protein C8E97_6741 [Saccharothrix australiensis]
MDRNRQWLRFRRGGQQWDLDVHRLTVDDTIALQELARGRTWGQVLLGLDQLDMVAVKVLLWAARRAAGDPVPFGDLSFPWGELAFEWIDGPTRPQGGDQADTAPAPAAAPDGDTGD